MKRRRFLAVAAAGGAAASVPSWIERAFAQQLDPDDSAADVANAYRRAMLAGRPLLVIVIPTHPPFKHDHGRAWGELLNHGVDEQLWPLALVEVVAAPYAAAQRIVPSLRGGEPLALVIETDGRPRSTAVGADLPSAMWDAVPEGLDGAEQDAWYNRRIDDRIARLAEALRAAIAGSARELAARTDQTRARLEVWERRRIDELLASGARIPSELARRGASLVAVEAARQGAARASLRARLAAVVREDLVEGRVSGAHWARSSGCGTYVEGIADDEQLMVACGMGHVPERSQRFLHFFAVRRRR